MNPSFTTSPTPPNSAVVDRLAYERQVYRGGCRLVAGVDEAGRGPLAGPVVAAAVILPAAWIQDGMPQELSGLNDSKQLNAVQRERFFGIITSNPDILLGIARQNADEIDRWNILQATHRAMNAALSQLHPAPDHVLVDGRAVPSMAFVQTAIVKGDRLSYSIAAASVVAKVTRDRLMEEFDAQWPQYGFADHKGYGTSLHRAAIARHGPCPIHRMTFTLLKRREQDLL